MKYSEEILGEINNASREELLEKIAELESSNASKNTFIANISHEIRTPMNAILGFSELILQLNESNEVNGYAKEIKSASNNLLAIINDLLDISKMESGKMELSPVPYFIHYLFSDVESVISIPVANKGIEFKMDINPEMPSQLYGDIVRIRQILINLCNNAVKFTREGYVELKADFKKGICINSLSEEVMKEFEEEKESFYTLEFKIIDTGIGIKEENLSKIFDKFQQVDMRINRGIEGTGLGLSISNQLVALMKGEISVESEYGRGTTFTVRIPQKVLDEQKFSSYMVMHAGDKDEKRKKFYAPGARILVVDDNPVNLRILAGLLQHYEIDPVLCESGFAAIEELLKNDYDLVFMDHMMPEMDGVETLKRIRQFEDGHRAAVKTVAVTANAIRGVKDFFVEKGFDDYLSKPIEVTRLEALLKNLLPTSSIVEETIEEVSAIPEGFDMEIEGVDIDAGLNKSGNNVRDYLDVLEIVAECGSDKAEELLELIAAKNYTNYTISVHALKSVAANIGAHQLCTMAKIHEMAGKNGQTDFLDNNYEKLISLYLNIVANIKKALEDVNVE